MKKLLLIGLLGLVLSVNCQGQWIQQIWTNPPVLTTNTPVQIIAEVDFPSGGCSDKTLNLMQVGNSISGYAIHCLGFALFICNDKDTFNLGLLPAGTYTFYYQVDIGGAPSPCTPGITPGPSDSMTFVVNLASTVEEDEYSAFDLFPNPTVNTLHIKLKDAISGSYKILNSLGAIVFESRVDGPMIDLDVSDFADGLYTFIFEDAQKNTSIKKFTKR